ncbi:MAG: hypothetical protein K1W33_08765 [Clostridia bacterium]
MQLLIFIVILTSILTALAFILYQTDMGKYKIKYEDRSVLDKENLNNFKNDYPEKDIDFLKVEIEKISDMLLDNQESNRYTHRIQEKAKNDYKLDEFRNEIPDSVEILDYKKGELKAQVNYILGKTEYTLIMYMDIVKRGRIFLKNYKSMKRVVS